MLHFILETHSTRVPVLSLLKMYNYLFMCGILGLLTCYDVCVTTENLKLEMFILVQYFTPFKILYKENQCVSFPEFNSSALSIKC
jgi:hypothetical protein